jgi:hypothetical protein
LFGASKKYPQSRRVAQRLFNLLATRETYFDFPDLLMFSLADKPVYEQHLS